MPLAGDNTGRTPGAVGRRPDGGGVHEIKLREQQGQNLKLLKPQPVGAAVLSPTNGTTVFNYPE